jgi:flagellar assembly protein FliH
LSSKLIPKEQLSAYQRWELDSLDESTPTNALPLPTAEEVENIQRQAHDEGFAAGYQEGRAKANSELARLMQMVSSLDSALARFDEELTQSLLALALDIAKQMVREALKIRPELVVPVVREAVSSLPPAGQHPHLRLHPEDAELVRTLLADELNHYHWKIVDDTRVERGGCRVETANSEIDATLESRWKKVLAAFGQEGGWLE